jgi:hypothetical protein
MWNCNKRFRYEAKTLDFGFFFVEIKAWGETWFIFGETGRSGAKTRVHWVK